MPMEMTVAGVTVDPVTKSPVVVLRDRQNQRVLPIWIGLLEAKRCPGCSRGGPPSVTHDLLKSILENTGTRLGRSRSPTSDTPISRPSTWGRRLVVDSVPATRSSSRCVARYRSSFEEVFEGDAMDEGGCDEGEGPVDGLEKMDPEQFSKYKM
jgi:hypothetical protein